MRGVIVALLVAVSCSGCVARTAYHVATVPVRAGSQVVDWSTTSRDEADRNRGRAMRRQEARERRQARKEAERQRRAQR